MKTNRYFFIILLFQLLAFLFLLQGCALLPALVKPDASGFLEKHKDEIGKSTQVLLVRDEGFLFFTLAKLYAFEKQGDSWRLAFEPVDAAIGRNGLAHPQEKREGDGKTPSGIYPLKLAFGYDESVKTKMPYRQTLPDDVWVDDPDSLDYNRWVKLKETQAGSFERMRRDDDLYKYGVVIEYNTDPVVRGNGSAIFLHLWKCAGMPTAGCVAVAEENILKILEWLNPVAHPLMILGAEN
jgi:L,D-peptidoglycan transpeptidase YkuD (ErfK/YbiS/YcfS/YnhG family)